MQVRRVVWLTLALTMIIALGAFSAPLLWAQTAPSTQQMEERPDGPNAIYYDFDDILVPRDLKLKREQSFVYDTATLTAGVLHLEGRVEAMSLADFFVQSMTRDNWLMAAKFTTPQIVLLFEKPNKRAIILVQESTFNTTVQIWVAPFMGAIK